MIFPNRLLMIALVFVAGIAKADLPSFDNLSTAQVETIVEESLRHRPPVQFLGRVATRDATLAGQTIADGDLVLVFIGAAGPDPNKYENPDDFSADRKKPSH